MRPIRASEPAAGNPGAERRQHAQALHREHAADAERQHGEADRRREPVAFGQTVVGEGQRHADGDKNDERDQVGGLGDYQRGDAFAVAHAVYPLQHHRLDRLAGQPHRRGQFADRGADHADFPKVDEPAPAWARRREHNLP